MAESDEGIAERSDESSRVTRRQGLTVVLAIAVIAALILVDLAFSTDNTNFSINGRSATSSQFIDTGNPTEFGGD